MKAKRLVPFVVAGTALFALSGCSESPNHAATVNGDAISTRDVDFLSRVQCDTADAAKGQAPTVARRTVRTESLNILVQTKLDEQLGKGAKYDRSIYQAQMDQYEPLVQLAAKKDRDRFRTIIGDYFRGQLQVFSQVQAKLVDGGVAQPTDQQVSDGANAEREAFRKSADIDINPVYGPDDNGLAGATDPSLSTAVSDFAKDSVSTNQETASSFVNGLPKNQRCG